MEKKTNFLKKIVTFSAGMVTMAILVTAIIPASAAGNQIAYNQVGIRTFGEQRVTAGEPYIAPNGQEVPSSITYTDAAGGKTNYLSVRQLCELLDAAVAWNADVNSVDIAPPYSDVSVVAGEEAAEVETASAPKYGQVVGGIEEIDPSTVADIHCGQSLEVLLPDRLGGGTWRHVSFECNDAVWYMPDQPGVSPVGLWAREAIAD